MLNIAVNTDVTAQLSRAYHSWEYRYDCTASVTYLSAVQLSTAQHI